MKKRGENLQKHYRQAFHYRTHLAPGRPRYVILCNFDESWVYDVETQMDSPVDWLSLAELPDRGGARGVPVSLARPASLPERTRSRYPRRRATESEGQEKPIRDNLAFERFAPHLKTAQHGAAAVH
jgi:hypothetical protein